MLDNAITEDPDHAMMRMFLWFLDVMSIDEGWVVLVLQEAYCVGSEDHAGGTSIKMLTQHVICSRLFSMLFLLPSSAHAYCGELLFKFFASTSPKQVADGQLWDGHLKKLLVYTALA